MSDFEVRLARGDLPGALTRVDEFPAQATDVARWLQLEARLAGAGEGICSDEALLALQGLRGRALSPWLASRVERQVALLFAGKRCEASAKAAAARAQAADPTSALGLEAAARIELTFDRREQARQLLETAVHLDEGWRAQLGLAETAYLQGDFPRAIEAARLAQAEPRATCQALRWRALIARACADPATELELLDRLLALATQSTSRRNWQLERAGALYRLGRGREATTAYRALWSELAEDLPGRTARTVLSALERAGSPTVADGAAGEPVADPTAGAFAGGGLVALDSFPTVAQKHRHCGPASLELLLRWLGIEDSQDRIAAQVMLPSGSPIWRMTRYLDRLGLEVRRFEWSPARFATCLAAGLPVVVEEEYSNSFHVALVIGLDRSRGLVFVQDPMTHAPVERPYAAQASAGELFGQSGFVAFPAARRDLAAALDRGDVLDQPFLRLLDSCNEDLAPDGSAPPVPLASEEVLRRCRAALALQPGCRLAQLRLASELLRIAQRFPSQVNIGLFCAALRELRVRFPDFECGHRLHGDYLLWAGRPEEAQIEFEEALRRDPGDVQSATRIAICEQQLGRLERARSAFLRALRLDPADVEATASFAVFALDRFWDEAQAREERWDEEDGAPRGDAGPRLDEQQLALHLAACGQEMAPERVSTWLNAARAAGLTGDTAERIACARRAYGLDPEQAVLPLAEALLDSPATAEEALGLYRGALRRAPGWFEPRLKVARWLARAGRVGEAVELLEQGIRTVEDDPSPLLRQLLAHVSDADSPSLALQRGRALCELRPTAGMRQALADLCEQQGWLSEAIVWHRRVEEARGGATAGTHAKIGQLQLQIARSVEEAEQRLRTAIELAPSFVAPRLALARFALVDQPEQTLELLADEQLLGPAAQGGDVLALRGRALARLGQFDEALPVLTRAFAAGSFSGGHDLYRTQDAYGQVLCRGGSCEALLDVPPPAEPQLIPRHRVLQFSAALACGQHAFAERVLDHAPPGDWILTSYLYAGCTYDEHWRPFAEQRAAAAGPADDYAQAVLAGSLATHGQRARLDQLLSTAQDPARLRPALRTLNDGEHWALKREIETRMVALAPDSLVGIEQQAALLRDTNQPEALAAHLARHLEHYPATIYLRGGELALALARNDPTLPACAEAMVHFDQAWSWELALAAAARLLRGDRPGAARVAQTARELLVFGGFAPAANTLLCGVQAVLDGDAQALARARQRPDESMSLLAPVWRRLAEVLALRPGRAS